MLYSWQEKSPTFTSPWLGWVADSATVIGDVAFGQHTSVWFGATIRGDNGRINIGNYSNVQENSVIHTDAGIEVNIGEYVTIGHLAMLHGCSIGDNTLVGIGAVILNNSKIGKNCIIGSKALIPEGKVIPDNSIVMGMPGKVVKEAGKSVQQANHMSALHYAQHSKLFKQSLKAIEPPA